jgi:transcriptional regulator with XRE-family HTH domain
MSTKKNKGTHSTEETLEFLEELVGPATLGSTLQAIRVSDEMTQKDFSEKLGISAKQLSDIENERRWVSGEKAQKFAQKLGYLEEDFVELAFQDYLKRKKIGMQVSVTSPNRKNKKTTSTKIPLIPR